MRLVVPGEQDRIEEYGEFTRIYHVRAPKAPVNSGYRMMYPNLYLRPEGRIVQILREERPDLVEINDKYTLNYLGGLLRERWVKGIDWRPTVIGLSCERMDENMAAYLSSSGPAARFVQFYMKWIYFPMCDHHIAVSPHTASELGVAARGHKVRRGVWDGPMGVDYQLFSSGRRTAEARSRLVAGAGGGDSTFLLLYAGRLAREKNVGLLIDLMEQLRFDGGGGDYRLAIAGDGELRPHLESEAARRVPGRVHFLGHVSNRQDLAGLYANADAFVHPNPREPFGIAPLESMAAGLPLLVANAGGVTAYANHQNAWLAPAEAAAFASQVRSIRTDAVTRLRKQEAARATAERFSWEAATDHFMRLYEELHALTQGHKPQPSISPVLYSTEGDYWGREIGVGAAALEH